MVSTIDKNPLVPDSMQTQKSLRDNEQSGGQTHRLNDLQMIVDRNVAPYVNFIPILLICAASYSYIQSSPRSMCAELAHDHALEDLHKITEHTSDPSDPVRGIWPRNYSVGCKID